MSPSSSSALSDVDQKALYKKNMEHFESSSPSPSSSAACSSSSSNNDSNGQRHLEDYLTKKVVHTNSNIWPRGCKQMRKKASRGHVYGVEIRILGEDHVLAGQKGLFAAKPFDKFDIVGEYCGEVVPNNSAHKEYTAELEEDTAFPLGVNAQYYGNELRTINHYQHIAPAPNVVMRIAYVEELPRVIIICTRPIAVGEELLLDYGDDYVKDHHNNRETKKKDKKAAVDWSELAGEETE